MRSEETLRQAVIGLVLLSVAVACIGILTSHRCCGADRSWHAVLACCGSDRTCPMVAGACHGTP